MAADVLVAYATKHGHTRRVAERVAGVLRDAGLGVALHDLGRRGADPSPADRPGVVVAASIHAGRHQKSVARWAKAHAATLAARPSMLLSVSLAAADADAEARAETRRMIDELVDATGWTPTTAHPVAGALQYREYDLPTRVLMRLIARRHDQPTDVSRDVDFTDWEELERNARQFAAAVAPVYNGMNPDQL